MTVPDALKPQFHYTLAQAAEAIRDERRAIEEYRLALEADPKFAAAAPGPRPPDPGPPARGGRPGAARAAWPSAATTPPCWPPWPAWS